MEIYRVLLAAALMLFCCRLEAEEIQRSSSVNAVGACQASLPVYDQGLRKKPLVVSNEGSSAVFISCSASNHAYLGFETVGLSVHNRSDDDATLNCTLVDGDVTMLVANYVTKSFLVPARNAIVVGWSAASDNGGNAFFRMNFSCRVPAKMDIGEIFNFWYEDVGS